jgi:hypothetical protein
MNARWLNFADSMNARGAVMSTSRFARYSGAGIGNENHVGRILVLENVITHHRDGGGEKNTLRRVRSTSK